VRALRRSAGLNLSDLGTLIGITYQQVQKYESGRSQMSAARIWNIALALGVDATAIYSTVSTETEGRGFGLGNVRPKRAERREARELVAEYSRLAPGVRTKLSRLAQSVSH
jgi:transcriptional regulator with XRE-family HTH domain